MTSRDQYRVLKDHILRNIGLSGMDTDFDHALDSICVMILDFDFISFTSNDIVPPKHNMFW